MVNGGRQLSSLLVDQRKKYAKAFPCDTISRLGSVPSLDFFDFFQCDEAANLHRPVDILLFGMGAAAGIHEYYSS